MIALTTAPQPFLPPWYIGADGAALPGARTYLVRPGSIMDRAMFEGVIAGPPYNAGRVFPWDLIGAAERAVAVLLPGEEGGQLLEALADWRANMAAPGNITAEHQQLLAGVEIALQAWPEYAELRRTEQRRAHILPMLAAKWLLAGWDGLDTPFTNGTDGKASDASLLAIPAHDLNALGWHAYNGMYAEQHRPLSPPASTSAASPPPSSAAVTRRAAKVAGK